MDLTLRDGINLQQTIQTAKDIDQQSKTSGLNQHALDQIARQGYGNARFETDIEEGLHIVGEFHSEQIREKKETDNSIDCKVFQKVLRQSARTIN